MDLFYPGWEIPETGFSVRNEMHFDICPVTCILHHRSKIINDLGHLDVELLHL